jgi:6-phosphogluconolactonase
LSEPHRSDTLLASTPADPVLYSFSTADDVSRALADFVVKAQNEGITKRDKFTLAVSGGSLPKVLAKDLVGREDVKWDKWCVLLCLYAISEGFYLTGNPILHF